MPPFSLVIFDLDGTLIDSAPDLCTALDLALSDFGLPGPGLEAVRQMVGEGQRVLIERALRHAGGDPGLLDAALERYRFHYSRHLVDRTVLYPGVARTLLGLPAAVAQGVATNKPGAWARQIVKELGIAGTLGWVLGEDDVGHRKPDPALLLSICRRAGVPPDRSHTLFVGDSAIDLRTAEAAGVAMALCTYGYADPRTLALARPGPGDPPGPRDGYPHYVIDEFPQLLPLIAGAGACYDVGS